MNAPRPVIRVRLKRSEFGVSSPIAYVKACGLVGVWFGCSGFGANDCAVCLSEWPLFRRVMGSRVLLARLVGSLV